MRPCSAGYGIAIPIESHQSKSERQAVAASAASESFGASSRLVVLLVGYSETRGSEMCASMAASRTCNYVARREADRS